MRQPPQQGSPNQLKGLWPELDYHYEQACLWYSPERFAYAPCGRQSGKTELSMRRLVAYLPVPKKGYDDPRYFYGGPTYSQAKRVAWHKLLKLIPRHWIADLSQSETYIRTKFGSELYLVGLDKPQRIEGLTFDGGVIDENSDIKPGTFDRSILPMLGLRHGWCWFIGIPKRFGVGAVDYRDNYEKACRGELPDSAGYWWPSSIHMPESELELARAKLDEYDYAEQYEANWLTAGGGVFHAFDREYNVRPCIYDPSKPILVGSDFNVDPMCWVFCHLQGDVLKVFGELFMRNVNTPKALQVMLARYGEHKGGFEMYGDASSRGRHTSAYVTDFNHIAGNIQLQALSRGMRYLQSNPPMADRFAVTNARLCSGDGTVRVHIDPTCTHLIRDLDIRTYKPGTREADDRERDTGHPSDALGYILYKRWPLRLHIQGSNIITIRKGP